MQTSKVHRIDWIDFGKGFTIFLVVIAHVFSGIYTNNIYNSGLNRTIEVVGETLFLFIMPVFFSLSGYLYKKPNTFADYLFMLKKKAWNLLTPYVAFSIIYILMNQVAGRNKEYTWSSLLHIYAMPISYLWFLYMLFFIFILVGGISLLQISINMQICLYLVVFILVKVSNLNIYILNVFGWAIFFCLGVIFRNNLNLLKNKICLYFSLVLTIGLLVTLFSLLGVSHRYYNDVSLINIFPKVVSDVFMFSVFMNVSSHTKFFSYFKKYGKYSLIIYMVHAPLLSAARVIILKFGMINELILIIILILIGWYGSLAVVWLNSRFKLVRFIFNAYSTLYKNNK